MERLYLDLFAWIQLTRARLGRAGSEPHLRAYRALQSAVTSDCVVVPLSSMHYMELLNVRSPHQRAAVALTMDELSNYVTLTPREVLIGYELRRSIARVFGRAFDAYPPPPLGHGAGHAFGRPGRMATWGPEHWNDQVCRTDWRAGRNETRLMSTDVVYKRTTASSSARSV